MENKAKHAAAANALYNTLEALANSKSIEICGGFTPTIAGPDDGIEIRFHVGHKMVVISVPQNDQPRLSLVNWDNVALTVGNNDEIERDIELPSPY